MVNKHAYLIMCHDHFSQLKMLLSLLDDKRNDIYIHVDKKAVFPISSQDQYKPMHASITWIKRENVGWGGYSQVKTEIRLLKEAVKHEHLYYHLISGVDLPLKTQDEIHAFFEAHKGEEFISIEASTVDGFNADDRVLYFRLFQDYIGRNTIGFSSFLRRVEALSLKIQKTLGIKRKVGCVLYKGANWFSITHKMSNYLLSREKDIRRLFRYGLGVDEMFLQTISMQSPYASSISRCRTRMIDWNRGRPYIWKSEDKEELLSSEALFARKFDSEVCCEIINDICGRLKNQK